MSFPRNLGKKRRQAALVDASLEAVLGGVDLATAEGVSLAAPAQSLSLGFIARYLWQVCKTGLPLLIADLAAILSCCCFATAVSSLGASWTPAFGLTGVGCLTGMGWSLILMQPIIGLGLGLYPGVGLSPSVELRLTSLATSVWISVLTVACVAPSGHSAGAFAPLALTWALAVLSVPLARSVTRSVASNWSWWGQPAVILGGGRGAAAVYRSLLADPARGLRPVGLIDDLDSHWNDQHPDALWYLGPPAETAAIVDEVGAFWGIVPLDHDAPIDVCGLLDRHAAFFPHLLVLRDTSSGRRSSFGACDCGGLSGLRIDERLLLPQSKIVKRAMDFVCALAAGIVLMPFVGLIAVGVKISSPGPVFSGQERIGRRGKKFIAWKFRCATVDAAGRPPTAPRGVNSDQPRPECWEQTRATLPRATAFGRWLGKTGLDGLPQLWNVLIAEMSLVGPRPIAEEEIEKYRDAFQLYTRVRPGMTGLWRISRRTSSADLVHLDAAYVRNWSPWLDLCLLARTISGLVVAGRSC